MSVDPGSRGWNEHKHLPVSIPNTQLAGYPWRNADLGPDVARANQLVNGGFDIWQRGTGPFTASGAYGPDRWYIQPYLGTVTLARIASTIGYPGYSAQLTYVHAGGGYCIYAQKLEHFATFAGKTVSVSAKVKSTVAGTIQLRLNDGITAAVSAYNIGTGEETLKVTMNVATGATTLLAHTFSDVASCTVEINDVMLVVGPVAADYVPLPPADDLARCLRYYEVFGNEVNSLMFGGYGSASNSQYQRFALVKKPVTPSMTKTGTWAGILNCAQPTVWAQSTTDFGLTTVVTALGNFYAFCAGSGQNVIAEANP